MKKHAATLLALLLSWGATLAVLAGLPERVPVHWNFAGEVDRYGSKYEYLILPAVQLVLVGFMLIWPRLDPTRRAEWRSWPTLVAATAWVLTLTQLAVLYLLMTTLEAGAALAPERGLSVLLIAAGLTLVLLGNYLPKAPQNWVFGIRTPWTLTSPRAWQVVHRVGGWLFVAVGLLGVILALALPPAWALLAFLGAVFLAILYLILLSYRVWRQEGENA